MFPQSCQKWLLNRKYERTCLIELLYRKLSILRDSVNTRLSLEVNDYLFVDYTKLYYLLYDYLNYRLAGC